MMSVRRVYDNPSIMPGMRGAWSRDQRWAGLAGVSLDREMSLTISTLPAVDAAAT